MSEGPYESLNLGILTDDDPVRVGENRAIAADGVGLDPAAIAMGWQVHGTDVARVGRPAAAGPGRYARARRRARRRRTGT